MCIKREQPCSSDGESGKHGCSIKLYGWGTIDRIYYNPSKKNPKPDKKYYNMEKKWRLYNLRKYW